jgi:lysyl-tRNA synthetase class II
MEFYLAGIELGNGYSELTDWKEQEKRLRSDLEERKRKKMKVFEPDRDFIEALKEGMSETSGIAVGIDRLIMLFTDSKDIRETNPFCL